MNERNAFQQQVDRTLSHLQWTERQKQQVLHAADRKRGPAMKKRTVIIALALCLCLMTGVAVAAYAISYTPQTSANQLAIQAWKEVYGLTDEAIGLFFDPVQEENGLYTFTLKNNLLVSDELTGFYRAIVADGTATVSWTHDSVPAGTYSSGALDCFIWGPPQINYLASLRQAERDQQLLPYQTKERKIDHTPLEISVLTPAPGEVTEPEAIHLALQVLRDTYGLDIDALPESSISTLMTDFSLPQPSWYVYVHSPTGDATYYVIINAQNGEIYRVAIYTPTR